MAVRSWIAALLVLALSAEAYLAAHDRRDRDGGAPAVVRVLTYNMRHGEGLDGRIDLARQAAILNQAAPDLVALQEVDRGTKRSGGVDQLAELARLTRMSQVFGKAIDLQGGAYGIGILSRLPIRGVRQRALPGSPDREARTALTVDVEVGERGPRVQFTTTHLDQGREAMDKVAQASYLAAALGHNAEPGILAGDMNARADTEPMQILTRRWTDTFVDPPPDADGRPRRRIDYVMIRPAASWRVVESRYIDAGVASDHQPILVVLEWLGERTVRATR